MSFKRVYERLRITLSYRKSVPEAVGADLRERVVTTIEFGELPVGGCAFRRCGFISG